MSARTARDAAHRARRLLLAVVLFYRSVSWLAADRAFSEVFADLPLAERTSVPLEAFLTHVTRARPNLDETYLRLLHREYTVATTREGVSLLVALAQMIHETDYLRFTGSVRATQYNYAGIGAVSDGHPGDRFVDMRTGVLAHVQHLKAYANTEALETALVDPRFHLVRRGSAPTVAGLTGTWAVDPDYARKVLAHAAILARLSLEPDGPDGSRVRE